MILPDKYMTLDKSFLGLGSLVLKQLRHPAPVSHVWESLRHVDEIGTFERFTLILDLLYALNLVDYKHGLIRKRTND